MLGAVGAQTSWAQPVQEIPQIVSMADSLYNIRHHDMTRQMHQYRVFLATPRSVPADKRLPAALYVLDGNAQFPLAVNAIYEKWSAMSGKAQSSASLPVIVGLGYPEAKAYPLAARTRDYTYAAPGDAFAAGGGAANFYEFVSSQVRPYIDKQYVTDPAHQILSGHSFGGLFALYVLLNHPDAFDQYVIGSPSLWWGNGAILNDAQAFAVKRGKGNALVRDSSATDSAAIDSGVFPYKDKDTVSVTILQGEYEENPRADPNITPERLARIQKRNNNNQMSARQLDAWLRTRGVDSHFMLVARGNHGDVIPAVIEMAARGALDNKAGQENKTN
ncbi:MAG TPA: esterase [Advenella kashmirensis]|uniref:Esterase n=1 Tax=Advenella kashmirensis TaxID=310575 RepID=A0A356LIX1_9BURK|nr:esterase [Advenella kashmirensis]